LFLTLTQRWRWDQQLFLHVLCRPIDEIDFRPRENRKEMQLGFGWECEGVCGV
jgi:hypothetical protein